MLVNCLHAAHVLGAGGCPGRCFTFHPATCSPLPSKTLLLSWNENCPTRDCTCADGEKGRCLAATPDDVAAYSFDFFVMRPKYLRHNVFDAYQDHERIARLVAEGRDFPEMLLHDAIKQSGLS
jgi:hypothetical protein